MDIRKFFGVVTPGKKPECGIARKEKPQNKEKNSGATSTLKEIKVKSSPHEEDFKQKPANKKKRIIYDSDSEEEVPLIKKSKQPERKLSAKSAKLLKTDPVAYVSETDEDEDFVNKKAPPKVKQLEKSGKGTQETTGTSQPDSKPKVKNKPLSPVKLTPTSLIDYFGTGSIQRSEKKLVSSKRKEPWQSRESTINDEAIAKELQLEENSKRERQLHEDEEFAQTLAMLDETPRKKKPRKDEFQQSKSGEAEKNKQAHKGKLPASAFDSQAYSTKDQIRSESVRVSNPRPESSATKEEVDWGNKRGSSKTSTRSTPLKQQAEAIKTENGTSKGENLRKGTVTPAGKTISPKTKTPTKVKVSPEQPKSISPEDSAEKKRTNYTAYRSFLNREGPKALGSKEIPQGGENCLEGMTFVITGILESIERDEAKSLIERYGGKVTGNISKKTNYLVKGRDCGMSKCDKASALGTKIIDEDGLFDLIRNTPGRRSKYEIAAETEAKRTKPKVEKTSPETKAHKRKPSPAKPDSDSQKKTLIAENTEPFKSIKQEAGAVRRGLDFLEEEEEEGKKQVPKEKKSSVHETNQKGGEVLLWVDKYKPTSLKTIIGQQGEQSCANKLLRWLKNWQKNSSEDKQVKSGKSGIKDDGANSKAALLSGPPGVGKTTTASLVCQELGVSYVELNASDTRSKKSLKEVVAESLNNTSIKGFCSGESRSVSAKHVLIMDEVDGMAGNEDRGGIQELIDLIKHTKIPIICMCNDRNHPKIRSLVHYCFDLRFPRPRVEQIKGAMMSIAFKEGLKVPPPAMNELILAANQDIRQVLHNLSMWCARDKTLTYDGVKEDASKAKKDIKLGPFDVVRKVFAKGEETSHMSLIDKADLFFHDYSLGPLFVQENYIHVKPAAAGNDLKKELILLSKTADSICDGDLVDRQIRSRQNWSLLPTQAIYSSVLPGELMRGYLQEFPSFPSWLGKFSSTGKHDRIVQELSMHMSLRTHAGKRDVNLDYLSYLRDAVARPLASQGSEGVQDAVAFMDSYCLLKEDVENLMEVTCWAGKPSVFSKLDPKVKSAFTRAYNKVAHLTPYSLQIAPKSKRVGSVDADGSEELESNDAETEEGSLESDAMIKKKTKPAKPPKAERKEERKKGKSKKKS
ncbi:replication factor C subunit 1 isoform X2 [Ahaetulla prasina]|uniref:replication factor C subunit 1 isoform X1 n=1 Tax=Ahaetulla prasina TaxID=499056 RepID=UPI00264941D9|nr:replication factor C subunit 1 isoform X1 [Ahaetulla prasina]XP_058048524.1 replication factor C subunit 1 isoform X2 [Ahaetulla prasina]